MAIGGTTDKKNRLRTNGVIHKQNFILIDVSLIVMYVQSKIKIRMKLKNKPSARRISVYEEYRTQPTYFKRLKR